jgi:hypothetical protein
VTTRRRRKEAVNMRGTKLGRGVVEVLAARVLPVLLIAMAMALGSTGGASAAEHRLGIGEMYWRTLEEVNHLRVDSDGLAPYLTYQYVPEGIFKFELDLEYYSKGFGGSDTTAYTPLAFVLVEFGIYAGLGVGVTVSDGLDDNVSDPFYAARVGWDFALIPRVHLDLNANYRAGSFKELEDDDLDSYTLGAAVRVTFK